MSIGKFPVSIERFFDDETNLVNLFTEFSTRQAELHATADKAIASHRAEQTTVRKALSNTANAIAELGGSATLLKKLQNLESQDAELTAKILELENQKTTPITIPSRAEARLAADKIIADLHSEDPVHVRQSLLSMVYQVLADRHGKKLVMKVDLFFDKKKELTYNRSTVLTLHPSVGAPIYRHSLKIEYLIQNQGNPQPVK